MQISMWGGREPVPGDRWRFWGYGGVPLKTLPYGVTEAEVRRRQRIALWVAIPSILVLVTATVIVGVITRSDVAVFLVCIGVPIALLMVATAVNATVVLIRYSQRKKRAAATPPTTDQTSRVIQS